MNKNNKPHLTKWVTGILCVFLLLVFISGIGLIMTGSEPGSSWMRIHKLSGTLFYIFLLVHIISRFKWYKAWLTGRIKKQRRNKFTIWCSFFFLLLIIIFLLKPILIPYYGIVHGIIGIFGCILMIFHFRDKRKRYNVS